MMNTMKVLQRRFIFQCQEDDRSVDVWVLAPDDDAMLQLLGEGGRQLLVDSNRDGAWAELNEILVDLGIDPMTSEGASKFRRIYPVTVDGFAEAQWRFDHRPPCERGPANVAWWGPASPPEFREADVEFVSHREWDVLDRSSRRELVRSALERGPY